jgi:2-hydroxy-6-oxo-octa-2,4-dienoate hydrolase
MYSYELPVTLGDVHVPSTIVWGRDDRVIPPECARLYADALPHASVQLISGGHFLDLEQPDALAEIIVTAAGRG